MIDTLLYLLGCFYAGLLLGRLISKGADWLAEYVSKAHKGANS